VSKRKVTFLVGDQNGYNRNIVADILRNVGFDDVHFARDGTELIDQTVDLKPKIVICNSRFPIVSGLEYARMVRSGLEGIDRALSVIVATNTATVDFVTAARASGVDEMLVRPITAAALLARVEAVLLRPRRFIDSINYVGPCRRRRMLDEYGGPLRRFTDPLEEEGVAPWEMATNRELVRQCVFTLSEKCANLAPGDRRKLREVYQAVEATKQVADEVRDEALGEAARSLMRYITAIGAARPLDPEVLSTHIDVMQKLGAIGSEFDNERQELIKGLIAVVDKRVKRASAA